MKDLKCKDFGTQGCPFVARGMTKVAIKKNMVEHIKEAHGDDVKMMVKMKVAAAVNKKMDKLLA
jgi:predicted small metal-binding protein